MILLIIAGIALTNFAVGDGPVVLSGYRPTYTTNNDYIPPEPIQLGAFHGTKSTQLSRDTQASGASSIATPSSTQVQQVFRIISDSKEPISGAQFIGYDGSGTNFQEYTDSNGYVAITGSPGNWQFTAYASGFFSNTWNRKYTYNASEVLILQKMGDQQGLAVGQSKNESEPIQIKYIDGCDLNKTTEQSSDLAADQSSYLGDEG
jgi:hypothetical protein